MIGKDVKILKVNGWNVYAKTECIDHIPDTNYCTIVYN